MIKGLDWSLAGKMDSGSIPPLNEIVFLIKYEVVGKNCRPTNLKLLGMHSDRNKINLSCAACGNNRFKQVPSGKRSELTYLA